MIFRIFYSLQSTVPHIRHFSTEQSVEPLKFLFPKLNPHGQWAGGTQTRLWTLAERRALFTYTRALQVHRHTNPDWTLIAERLDRDPRECKFIASYMTRSWIRHKNLSKSEESTIDAGVTANQLLAQDINMDEETQFWLRKLSVPPEPALATPLERKRSAKRVRHCKWSPEELQMLQDLYPLLRHARAPDMDKLINTSGRTIRAISVKKSNMVCRLDTKKIQPLTDTELDVIRTVVDSKSADSVTWQDVRDQLPGRSFEQVLRLLEEHRVELYHYERSRRTNPQY